MSKKAYICCTALLGIALLAGCSDAVPWDPIKAGINPQVVEVVNTARSAQTSTATDAALLAFYFNNRPQLQLKDVQYIAHRAYNSSTTDTILMDWASTQRMGIPYVPPEGMK
jgi:hypothetical protein